MYVYRVENASGEGPYQGGHISIDDMYDRLVADVGEEGARSTQPNVFQDSWDRPWRVPAGSHAFGFRTKGQMERWFTPSCRQLLADRQYFLVTYDVGAADVIFGGHQLVFDKSKAKLIQSQPIQ